MFIHNKYYKWYNKIINNALERSNLTGYFETHHIIPKSLGGLDNSQNLVKLTAREHFICHYLLTKFTSGNDYKKMVYACQGMRRSRIYQDRYINSRLYEIVKLKATEIQKEKFSGKKLSKEHRAAISEGLKGRVNSLETIEKRRASATGLKRTEEQKLRMSQAQKERAAKMTPEEKKKISDNLSAKLKGKTKGIPKSEEHRKKLSNALKGKTKGIPKSEETKQKMRKPKSDAHRKAISEARKFKYAAICESKLDKN
jgi:hypothetical protein